MPRSSDSLFPFGGGDGGSPGGRTVWPVGYGRPVFPFAIDGGGRELCGPPKGGEAFPEVDKGKLEGMGAPCDEIDGPLAGGVLGN